MKVLFVGSNPSVRSDSNEAFSETTLSGRILRSWIEGISAEFAFENIVQEKTEGNRPLKKSEMAAASDALVKRIAVVAPDRVVALGKSAAQVLAGTGLKFLEMPHPSGLNRKLNDKDYVAECLDGLRAFCSSN
jgi:uracil-DNA glycosylase family 4